MKKCKHPGCSKDGILSCNCDYSIRLCDMHYSKNHFDSNPKHSMILTVSLVEKFSKKASQGIKKLEIARNMIITTAAKMMKTLQHELSLFLTQIYLKDQEIKKIIIEENFSDEIYKDLEKRIEIKDQVVSLEGFNKIIKEYLDIIVEKKNFIYPFGDKYEGEWKEGKKHGKGTYSFASGSKYEGEWEEDKKHGKGTYSYASRDKYEGEWKEGKKHGKGTYIYAPLDRYEGVWKDDKRHGKGIFISGNIVLEQIWENGNRIDNL
jgi:hypothetical protein